MSVNGIAAPPDITGAAGRAWLYSRLPDRPDVTATIRSWIVEAPAAHPLWHSYFIGVIHLRDIPGVVPATILLPGATHEVFVYALDPRQPAAPDLEVRWLRPINFAGQWIASDDERAIAKVEGCVRDICDGRLSPDTDWMQHWIARFSASHVKGELSRAGETRVVIDGKTEIIIPPRPRPADGAVMKAVTLLQPWAALVVAGVLTRVPLGWCTHHRGPVAIHAGPELHAAVMRRFKTSEQFARWLGTAGIADPRRLPREAVIGEARIARVVCNVDLLGLDPAERDCVKFNPGGFAWSFEAPVARPVERVKGRFRELWEWTPDDGPIPT